jgi:hypothetical protein
MYVPHVAKKLNRYGCLHSYLNLVLEVPDDGDEPLAKIDSSLFIACRD